MSGQRLEEVTVHDASAYFSQEEWNLLHEWQKELYRNVMREIHQALLSLGPLIATTVLSLRTQEKQDLVPLVNQDSERRHGIQTFASDAITNTDVLLKINREEKLCPKNPQDTEARKQSSCLGAGFPFLSTDVSLRKEEEPASIFIDHLGEEVGESSNNPNSGFTFLSTDVSLRKKEEPASIFNDHLGEEVGESSSDPNSGQTVVSFNIKDEEEPSCMDHQDSRRIKSTSSTTGVNPSVNSNKQQENRWERPYVVSTESGREFDHKLDVTNHQRIKTGETLKGCTEYGSSFNPMSNAIEQKGTQRGERPYSWTECGEKFSESPHQKMHPGLEMFICSQCGNCFNQSANDTHQQINREQQNTCSKCEKSLHQPTQRKKDQDMYMGKRYYKCSECGKSFQKSQKLMIHQRVHTGEKPYPCHICGKNFRQLPHLVIHQRMHTGEKPYVCRICERGFIDSSHLKRHQQIHTKTITNMKPTGIETANKTVEG